MVNFKDRAVSKAKLLKINLPQACLDITRSSLALPAPPPPPSRAPAGVPSSEEEEEGGKGRKRRRKKTRPKKGGEEEEEGEGEGLEEGLGLRLSANLLLGVARVYDLQVHTASDDAVQIFLNLRPGFMDEYLGPTAAAAAAAGAGGKGRGRRTMGLDMVETAVNIDAPMDEEAGDDLALGLDFGGDAWDDLGYGSVPSWTTVASAGMEVEEEVEEEAEVGRAAEGRRPPFPPGRPSSIGLRSPGLSIASRRSQPPYGLPAPPEPELEPLDLGLEREEGAFEGLEEFEREGRPSSSVADLEYEYGPGMEYQPQLEGPAFPELPPAPEIEMAEAPPAPAPAPSAAAPSPPRPILKLAGAAPKRRKKAVRLAVRDEALTHADEEMRDWRATYVDRMLDQGHEQRRKADERAARQQADEMLLGMPDLIGFQDRDMAQYFLEQQNRRRAFAPPAAPAAIPEEGAPPPPPPPSEEERRRREEEEFFQQQAMGGQLEEYEGGMEVDMGRYVEYEYPLAPEVSREGEEVELGRRAPSAERRVSVAPWEVSSVGGREPSIGLEGVHPPSSVGRPSSVPESDILAGRRPRPRASARVSVERESVGVFEGMEGEAPIEGLLEIERESALETSVTSASRAQQQFLDYLKTSLVGVPAPSPPSSPPPTGVAAPALRPEIPFSTLVPPDSCTPIVAAKGLYQVLVLATRDTLGVRQTEAFGEILISIKEQPVAHEEPAPVEEMEVD